MIKVGVVLSGCGVFDGTEIHESVLTLLALSKRGAEAVCMAPDIDQAHVINHVTQQEMKEKRNVLVESARIARGQIRDIRDVKAQDLDALIFPGGYGAAKNLSTFAFDGVQCKVNADVEKLVREMHKQGKPTGFICIAPAIAAKIFEHMGIQLTIGNDPGTAEAIRRLGQKHCGCTVKEIAVDEKNKIVSTPAYMLAGNIAEAAAGIEKCVDEVLKLSGRHAACNRN